MIELDYKDINSDLYATSNVYKILAMEICENETLTNLPEPFINSLDDDNDEKELELVRLFMKNYNFYEFEDFPLPLLKKLGNPLVRQIVDEQEKIDREVYGEKNSINLFYEKCSQKMDKSLYINPRIVKPKPFNSYKIYLWYQILNDLPIQINDTLQYNNMLYVSTLCYTCEFDSLNTFKSILELFTENIDYKECGDLAYIHKAKKILKYILSLYKDFEVKYLLLLYDYQSIIIFDIRFFHSEGCQYAAREGKLDCLKYFHENGCEWDTRVAIEAAENGHLDCLQYFSENSNMEEYIINNDYICYIAARKGHLNCLEYAHKFGYKWNSDTLLASVENKECFNYMMKHYAITNKETILLVNECIRKNQFESLKVLLDRGYKITTNSLLIATQNNNWPLFYYCLSNYTGDISKVDFTKICLCAIEKGNYTILSKVLTVCQENNIPLKFEDNNALVMTIKKNNLYIFELLIDIGEIVSSENIYEIIQFNKLLFFKVILKKNCILDLNDTIKNICVYDRMEFLEYLFQKAIHMNAIFLRNLLYTHAEDKMDYVKYFHERQCPWPEDFCDIAAGRYTTYLIYAHERGCPWSEKAVQEAVQNDNLKSLQYLLQEKCPYSELSMNIAVEKDYLECLKMLHEHGCPCSEDTIYLALENARLDCMKYLHENGCPWPSKARHNEKSMSEAWYSNYTSKLYLECLQYAHNMGCPLNPDVARLAAFYKRMDLLKFSYENGYPWDERVSSILVIRQNEENNYDEDTDYENELNMFEYLLERNCPLSPYIADMAYECGFTPITQRIYDMIYPDYQYRDDRYYRPNYKSFSDYVNPFLGLEYDEEINEFINFYDKID